MPEGTGVDVGGMGVALGGTGVGDGPGVVAGPQAERKIKLTLKTNGSFLMSHLQKLGRLGVGSPAGRKAAVGARALTPANVRRSPHPGE
jgi:hypothetical protein